MRRKTFVIPIFFHNLRGYDGHLISRAFAEPEFARRDIDPIAQTAEKYIQIRWGKHIVFRDSLQFLGASLDTLVRSLSDSNGRFPVFDEVTRIEDI